MSNRLFKLGGLAALALSSGACVSRPTPVVVKSAPVVSAPVKQVLGHNVAGQYNFTPISSAEETFSVPKVNLYDSRFFAIPLTGPKGEELANSTIPSFYLIPDTEARVSEQKVGVPGGKIIVDSITGSNYVPYGVEADVSNPNKPLLKLRDVKKDNGFTRIVVPSMNMPAIAKSTGSTISLETMTETDLPFATTTLGIGENARSYAVFPMSNNQAFDSSVKKADVLPFYFVEIDKKDGVTIERYGTNASNPSVYGKVVVFSKEGDTSAYAGRRGIKPSPAKPGQPGAYTSPVQKP